MDARDAARLIATGVTGRVWADLGAGRGTFTMALAALLGPSGRVYAVEREAGAIDALERLAHGRGHDERALIEVVRADFARTPLPLEDVDGLLMANSLHYVADDEQAPLLARLANGLNKDGVLLVVEYDNRPRSRWVPFPVTFNRLAIIAAEARFAAPALVGRRESAFGGTMYAAVHVSEILARILTPFGTWRCLGLRAIWDFAPFGTSRRFASRASSNEAFIHACRSG